jgi:hypothetical protein
VAPPEVPAQAKTKGDGMSGTATATQATITQRQVWDKVNRNTRLHGNVQLMLIAHVIESTFPAPPAPEWVLLNFTKLRELDSKGRYRPALKKLADRGIVIRERVGSKWRVKIHPEVLA